MKNIGKFKVAFLAALSLFVFSCKDNAANNTGAEGTEYNSADGMGEGDAATSPGSNMDTDGTGGSGTMNDTISGGTGTGGTGTGTGGTGTGTGTGGTGTGTTGAGGAGTTTGTP